MLCVITYTHTPPRARKRRVIGRGTMNGDGPRCGEVIKVEDNVVLTGMISVSAVDWLDCLLLLLITSTSILHYRRQQHRIFKTFDFVLVFRAIHHLGFFFFLFFLYFILRWLFILSSQRYSSTSTSHILLV